MKWLVAIALVQFVTAGGARVDVNPVEVSSVREPAGTLLSKNVKCVIGFTNGRFLSLAEDCSVVRRKLQGGPCVRVCGGEER